MIISSLSHDSRYEYFSFLFILWFMLNYLSSECQRVCCVRSLGTGDKKPGHFIFMDSNYIKQVGFYLLMSHLDVSYSCNKQPQFLQMLKSLCCKKPLRLQVPVPLLALFPFLFPIEVLLFKIAFCTSAFSFALIRGEELCR